MVEGPAPSLMVDTRVCSCGGGEPASAEGGEPVRAVFFCSSLSGYLAAFGDRVVLDAGADERLQRRVGREGLLSM